MNEAHARLTCYGLFAMASFALFTRCGDGMAVPAAEVPAATEVSLPPVPTPPDSLLMERTPPQRFDSSTFNLITMAPGYARSNNFPFYFQSGLVYTGLIPQRDKDISMIALGYGAYQGNVTTPSKTFTSVLEAGYRYQLNGWSFVQPFFQYLMNPAGNGQVLNAAVLGFSTGITF